MFKWKDRKYVNPRKKIFKNLDTNEILNLEVQDDEDNIQEESDTPLSAHCLNLAQQELVDDMSKTFTGTNITAPTVKGTGRVNKVYGFCRQETREGRNKFDLAKISNTSKFEVTQTGVKLKNCWANDIYFPNDVLNTFKPNTTYTMRAKAKVISRPSTIVAVQTNLFLLYRPSTDSLGGVQLNCLLMNDKSTIPLNEEKAYISTFTTPADMTNVTFKAYTFYGNNDGGTTSQGLGEIEVSEIMLVEGSYTEDNFPDYEPYGVMPSPEFPAKVHCLGDDKQLFDRSACEENKLLAWATGLSATEEKSLVSDFIKVYPNEKIIQNYASSVFFYDTNKNHLGNLSTGGLLNTEGIAGAANLKKYTIPNENSIAYMRLSFRTSNNSNIDMTTVNIKVQEGTVATPWSPFGYGTVVNKSTNKNLCPKLLKGIEINEATGIEKTNSARASSDYIKVDFNTNYYVSGLFGTKLWSWIGAYNSEKQFLGRTSGSSYSSLLLHKNSFVGGTPQGTGDIAYLRVTSYVVNGQSTGSIDDIDNAEIQLEPGSTPTDYVQHKEDTQTIYLKEPLLGIDDVQDELDLSNKEIERKFVKTKLDNVGNHWNTSDQSSYYYLDFFYLNSKPKANGLIMSSHFKHNKVNGIWIGSQSIAVQKAGCPCSTFEEFKTWIAEQDIEVVYELATPIIESIDCTDKIAQFDGQTTIYNVDGAELECTLTNNRAIAEVNENLHRIEGQINEIEQNTKLENMNKNIRGHFEFIENSDANKLTKVGLYRLTGTLTNYPSTSGGILEVNGSEDIATEQIFTQHNGKKWNRICWYGTWSSWLTMN